MLVRNRTEQRQSLILYFSMGQNLFLTRNVKYICLVLKCRSDVFVLFEDVKLKILLEKFLEKLIKNGFTRQWNFRRKGRNDHLNACH